MAADNLYDDGTLVDALRISDAQWYACVQEMDQRAMQKNDASDKRQSVRQPYRNIAKMIVSLRGYDGRLQQFKVRAYDLSESGLGFLHGAYIYDDTPAEILMHHHVHGMTRIPAMLVKCVHVKGRVHRVGAKFNTPIDLDGYLLSEAG